MRPFILAGLVGVLCFTTAASASQQVDELPPPDAAADQPVAAPVATPAAPPQPLGLFEYPTGLSISPERLFEQLGYIPGYSVPMTANWCYELAYLCYIRGWYRDALILADRGLLVRNDARLHLLKGVCQLYLRQTSAAEVTGSNYLAAVAARNTIGLDVARERVNDPMRVRFEVILAEIVARTPPAPR
jgi:hypothetical protein